MDLLGRLRLRLANLLRRRDLDNDIDRELQFHVDMETEQHLRAGLSPNEARRLAQIAFGGRQRFREATRDEVHSRVIADLIQDARHALRTFRRAPAFTITVLLTLAIGIGATTTIFSVTDHVVLRRLATANADRMASIEVETDEFKNASPTFGPNAAHFLAWKSGCTTCEQIALLMPQTITVYGVGDPTVLPTMRVSGNLFTMLGAKPQLGRLIMPGDDEPGSTAVVVISDALWRQQFGARRDIVGQTIEMGKLGAKWTIIGVTPPDFPTTYGNVLASFTLHPVRAELFIPLSLLPYQRTTHGEYGYGVLALLRPGATMEALRSQLDAITVANAEQLGDKPPKRAAVTPLQQAVTGSVRRPLLLLLGAVVSVLLIMCVNLANLFLARSTDRRRESAVRLALGAARGRLTRQALTETITLAVAGGSLGIAVATWGVRALVAVAPPELPRLNEVQVDVRVVAAGVMLSLLAGLAFGLLPALRFGDASPGDVLKERARGASEGRAGGRVRATLIASQVGLSALLLVAGGLFLKSFIHVLHADKGFTAERVLAVDVPVSPYEYASSDARNAVYDAAMREIAALPGVTGTAMTSYLPLEGEAWGESIYRVAPNGTRSMDLTANFRFVTPNYFALLGVPILEGRAFTNADRGASRMVVSENAAHALWPNESAIGKRAPLGGTDSVYEVIGVAANVRTSGIEHEASPTVYRPYWEFGRAENIVIRTAVDPSSLVPQVRRIIRSLAPTAPIAKVRTIDEVVARIIAERRFELVLIELFAATALLTACVGIYGIISYSLGSRAGEISIRLALGAEPRHVHALVARETLLPLAAGLIAGLAAAALSGRAIAGMLYDVQSTDGATLGSVAAILIAVGALACWIPARRATRLDPVEALRAG